jgi:hypothetical protein
MLMLVQENVMCCIAICHEMDGESLCMNFVSFCIHIRMQYMIGYVYVLCINMDPWKYLTSGPDDGISKQE